jgi:hypothetical protein
MYCPRGHVNMHSAGRGRSCAILGWNEATTAMVTVVRMNFIVIQIVDDGCFLRLERKMRSGVRSWHHLFAVASVAKTELRVPCRTRFTIKTRLNHKTCCEWVNYYFFNSRLFKSCMLVSRFVLVKHDSLCEDDQNVLASRSDSHQTRPPIPTKKQKSP